ncbi:MAG TPA: hypothetical protein VE441_09745 [Mycobacterium sp.]|jgi:predicted lipoprotein with Yx(FWY)xxD motif|nr:hypothetical protein [Mycobacterium sp.]
MSLTLLRTRWLVRLMVPAATVGLVAATGCSSGGGSCSSEASTTASNGSATTVTVRTVSGQPHVLTTASGQALYVSEQEHGRVLCTSSACTAIWIPFTVPAGTTPTGPSQIAGNLRTMAGAGGKTQVAFDSRPLYTFSFDHCAGELGGDGKQDNFGGISFTWHVATTAGLSPTAPTTPSASSGGGYGGY